MLTKLGAGFSQPFVAYGEQGPAPYYIIDNDEIPVACRFQESLRSVRCVAFPHGEDEMPKEIFGIPLSDATPWLIRRGSSSDLLEITPHGLRSIVQLGVYGEAYPYNGVLFARQGNDLLRWDNMEAAGTARRQRLGDSVYRVNFLAGSVLTQHGDRDTPTRTVKVTRLRSAGPAIKGDDLFIDPRREVAVGTLDCGSHGAAFLSDDHSGRLLVVSSNDFKLHEWRGSFDIVDMTCSADGIVFQRIGGSWLEEQRCGLASCTTERFDISGLPFYVSDSVPLGDKTLLVGFQGDLEHPPVIPYFSLAKLSELSRAASQPLLPDGLLPRRLVPMQLKSTKAGALVLLMSARREVSRRFQQGGILYVVRITPEGKVEKVERVP